MRMGINLLQSHFEEQFVDDSMEVAKLLSACCYTTVFLHN